MNANHFFTSQMETSQMDIPSDLKIMTQYKKFTLRKPYYTSCETQQIYDSQKNVRTCDSHGYVIIEVLDERNTFSGFRYAKFRRAAILKYNNDYNYEKERDAPRYRCFDLLKQGPS